MRQLKTFVLHLWVSPEADSTPWDGQVEFIQTGEHSHITTSEEAVQFINNCLDSQPESPSQRNLAEGKASIDTGHVHQKNGGNK